MLSARAMKATALVLWETSRIEFFLEVKKRVQGESDDSHIPFLCH